MQILGFHTWGSLEVTKDYMSEERDSSSREALRKCCLIFTMLGWPVLWDLEDKEPSVTTPQPFADAGPTRPHTAPRSLSRPKWQQWQEMVMMETHFIVSRKAVPCRRVNRPADPVSGGTGRRGRARLPFPRDVTVVMSGHV